MEEVTERVQKVMDPLGDRLKAVEQVEAGRRCDRTKPLMARLDGKAFHTFTRGLERPYDVRLSTLMIDTARYLVEQTHAKLSYTQSDEISLHWTIPDPTSGETFLFSGKYQKMASVLAGMASAFFTKELAARIPEKAHLLGVFDCRVWNVEDMNEVYLNYLWRQQDAVKNSISMAAQACFSHKTLHGVGSEEKKQKLRDIGHPWEAEPEFFKWGSFAARRSFAAPLTPEQLNKIPEKFRPTGDVMRSDVQVVPFGYIEGKQDLFA
jgi:tRNA(His) 5'-end guanylyltransferase